MSGGKRGTTVTKQKWTDEEEAALRAGVEKYDVGKWRHIQKDEVLGPILKNRSNVDLKDKWRNLNMDSSSSRRDGRGGGGDRGRRKRKKRDKASDLEDDDDADYVVAGRMRAASRRRRLAQRSTEEETELELELPDTAPEQIPVTEESILAAMIQIQDPHGSDADTICQWLEDNYGMSMAVKRTVKSTLKHMMEAGRITCRHGLYKLAGIPQQLVEESTRYAGEEVPGIPAIPSGESTGLDLAYPYSHHSNGSKTAREAAEAAARAVQEAEEAAELAAELIAAADRFDRETPTKDGSAPAQS